MRRAHLIGTATALAALALGLFAYQLASAPTVLRVAVGPAGSDDARLVAAMAQYLARERSSIRLKLVPTEGPPQSARALDGSEADLAVVRPDIAMPAQGQTVAILHRDAALLLATPAAGIRTIADLKGRRVAVLRNLAADRHLLDLALTYHDVPSGTVTAVAIENPGEAEEALASGRADAVLAVGPATGRAMGETVAAVARAGGGEVVFVLLGEAAAIAQASPLFEVTEVVRGAFGGAPLRPTETLTSLGVSLRLAAALDLDEHTVAELARLIFTMRPIIAAEVPLANRIEAPDTDKGASLPVHAGAAAYYDGEVLTFFERYGDWFYLGVMALSILGSAAAGLATAAANRSRARNMEVLEDLLSVVRRARDAELDDLDALAREADDILATALAKAGRGTIGEAGVAAYALGLDQARQAIAERRRLLLAAGVSRLGRAAE